MRCIQKNSQAVIKYGKGDKRKRGLIVQNISISTMRPAYTECYTILPTAVTNDFFCVIKITFTYQLLGQLFSISHVHNVILNWKYYPLVPVGIRKITSRAKLPFCQGWGFGQGQGQFQGWGAARQLLRRKIDPCLGLGFVLELVLELGGNFLRGQLPRTVEDVVVVFLKISQFSQESTCVGVTFY